MPFGWETSVQLNSIAIQNWKEPSGISDNILIRFGAPLVENWINDGFVVPSERVILIPAYDAQWQNFLCS